MRNYAYIWWTERTAFAYNGPNEKNRVITARSLFWDVSAYTRSVEKTVMMSSAVEASETRLVLAGALTSGEYVYE